MIQQTTVVSRDTQEGLRTLHSVEPKDPVLPSNKLAIIQKDQNKKKQGYKVDQVSSEVHTDIHNFSLESERETEYVSTSYNFTSMHF